jgi:ubiquinone/menaquinone biosynthesis C-methylase UbiE
MSTRTKDYRARHYPESRFGGFTDVDGTIAFYTRVHSLLETSFVVLDVGCGRGAYGADPVRVRRELRIFKGKCRRVIGIDPDEQAGGGNPFLDEFRLLQGERWPVEDASVDLCVCDSVLEHVREPETFFAECRRVIKPGGYLCLRTANALNYISIFSRLIPNRLHAAVLGKVLSTPREEEDIFPTLCRCNTARRIRKMLDKHGFEHCVYGYEAEPYHLGFSRLAYLCGVLHQRLAPRLFKSTIFAFARRIP